MPPITIASRVHLRTKLKQRDVILKSRGDDLMVAL